MILFDRSLRLLAVVAIAVLIVDKTSSRCCAQDAAPTFHKEILPILQKHCLACHHKGGAAPQSMETYKDMKPWIRSTKKEVNNKTMPPWHCDPAVGHWKNDGRLSEAEIKTINAWADAKGPEGDAKDAPPPIDFSKPWKMGTPDLVLGMEAEFEVPAQGHDVYKAFLLAHDFAADNWVSGVEFSPGDVGVTQDMALSVLPASSAKADDAAAFDAPKVEGAKSFIAVWNKGIGITEMLPSGTGILIPKGSKLLLQIHYKTIGESAKDQTKVGLYLAKSPAAKELKTAAIENRSLDIPANAMGHKTTAEWKTEKAIKIHAVLPRMHYFGHTFELAAQSPDGKNTPIVKIDDYNYDFQTLYSAAEPIALAAGTKLAVAATYDNSCDNPHCPSMSVKKAGYGPAPDAEILSAVIYYTEE